MLQSSEHNQISVLERFSGSEISAPHLVVLSFVAVKCSIKKTINVKTFNQNLSRSQFLHVVHYLNYSCDALINNKRLRISDDKVPNQIILNGDWNTS